MKQTTTRNTLYEYNRCIELGYKVAWVGEGFICWNIPNQIIK